MVHFFFFFFFGKIGHSDQVLSELISVFAGVVVKSYLFLGSIEIKATQHSNGRLCLIDRKRARQKCKFLQMDNVNIIMILNYYIRVCNVIKKNINPTIQLCKSSHKTPVRDN